MDEVLGKERKEKGKCQRCQIDALHLITMADLFSFIGIDKLENATPCLSQRTFLGADKEDTKKRRQE